MNLAEKYDPIASRLSIGQFCPPRCFELVGQKFRFIMDSGEETGDITLNFLDETRVEFSVRNGKRSGEAAYECRKSDDWTYLVTYCLQDPRENHTFVIDKEQGLVTFLRCPLGENPYYPYLIESHWTFGYIFEEGKEHTDWKRHGFTEYAGESVEFHASGVVTIPILGTKAVQADKLAFDPDRKKRRAMYPEVVKIFKDYSVYIGGSTSFDFAGKQYNKYDATLTWAKEHGYTLDDIIFIGDDFADGGGDSHVRIKGMDRIVITDYRKFADAVSVLLK